MTKPQRIVLLASILSVVSAVVVPRAGGALVRADRKASQAGVKPPVGESIPKDVKISAGVDRTTVEVGSQLTLTLTIEGELSNAELTPFELPKPLVVVAQSRSTNLSVQAGAMKRSVSLVYVLAAQQPGTCQLGPFQLTYRGTQVRTEPIEIVIRKPVLPPSLEPHERFTL